MESALVSSIMRATKGGWRAAAWMLETIGSLPSEAPSANVYGVPVAIAA